MVAGLRGRTYEQKMRKVGLTTLEETSRILNGIDQVEASTWFTMATDRDRTGAAITRHSRDTTMIVGVSKIDVRKNFFSQRVPRYWNSLPETTR